MGTTPSIVTDEGTEQDSDDSLSMSPVGSLQVDQQQPGGRKKTQRKKKKRKSKDQYGKGESMEPENETVEGRKRKKSDEEEDGILSPQCLILMAYNSALEDNAPLGPRMTKSTVKQWLKTAQVLTDDAAKVTLRPVDKNRAKSLVQAYEIAFMVVEKLDQDHMERQLANNNDLHHTGAMER